MGARAAAERPVAAAGEVAMVAADVTVAFQVVEVLEEEASAVAVEADATVALQVVAMLEEEASAVVAAALEAAATVASTASVEGRRSTRRLHRM